MEGLGGEFVFRDRPIFIKAALPKREPAEIFLGAKSGVKQDIAPDESHQVFDRGNRVIALIAGQKGDDDLQLRLKTHRSKNQRAVSRRQPCPAADHKFDSDLKFGPHGYNRSEIMEKLSSSLHIRKLGLKVADKFHHIRLPFLAPPISGDGHH